MKRPTAILTTLVSAAILVAVTPGIANAESVTAHQYDGGPRSITVNTAAKITKGGAALDWRIRIKCPKGEKFYAGFLIAQEGAAAPRKYPGATVGTIGARQKLAGTCTGKNQKFTVTLPVAKTPITTTAGKTLTVAIPITRTDAADLAIAWMGTPQSPDRGSPEYCSFVPSPSEDGTSCEEYTLLGPNLRLR